MAAGFAAGLELFGMEGLGAGCPVQTVCGTAVTSSCSLGMAVLHASFWPLSPKGHYFHRK